MAIAMRRWMMVRDAWRKLVEAVGRFGDTVALAILLGFLRLIGTEEEPGTGWDEREGFREVRDLAEGYSVVERALDGDEPLRRWPDLDLPAEMRSRGRGT